MTDPASSPNVTNSEAGLRLSVELQLTYATGVVAGTLMGAYTLVTWGQENVFPSAATAYLAAFLASLLELATIGMILHITYRGFWMAMRLLVETRSDQGVAAPELLATWEAEIRELDGTCQAFFFRTFRILYTGMLFGVFSVGVLIADSKFLPYKVLAWSLQLTAVTGLIPPLTRLRRPACLARRLERLERRLTGLRRAAGLWWISSDPIPLHWMGWVGLVSAAAGLVLFNFSLMFQGHLETDRKLYSQSARDPVVLTFSHGGFDPGEDAAPRVSVSSSSLSTQVEAQFQRQGSNRYVTVLDSQLFKPGPVSVRVNFGLRYQTKGESHLSVNWSDSSAEFVVVK